MSSELRECPFCTGTLALIMDPRFHSHEDNYYMECQYCYCHGPVGTTEQEAIELWNQRGGPSQ